ncbi:hypothetical protein BJ166DRAFT_14127 [Pestalotiopsis sp. NC0098]|nr:hypothetical protein BJ166DRAFT_14127 [Pestalotiopsis sp. NC0098]
MPSPVDNDAGFQISWNSHFSRYIQDNWKNGMNIDKVPSKYVTEDILTKYWTTDTVTKIKNECRTPIPITPEIILASLVRVWSALVFIGRPEFITWFHQNGRDDEFFFSTGFSGTADQDLALQGMLKDLREHWGKFWPVRLKPPYMHQRLLESQRVLPIHSWRELSQPDSGSRTTIHEVKLDPLCCEESNLSSSSIPIPIQTHRQVWRLERRPTSSERWDRAAKVSSSIT